MPLWPAAAAAGAGGLSAQQRGSTENGYRQRRRDTKIRPDAFTDTFTVEQFADVLFSQMLSAMLRQDCDPTAVLEIVRRTLY